MKIGFIGLGIMGKPMACNLVKAGFDVNVYNRTKSVAQEVAKLGAKTKQTIAQLAADSDYIITMLPDSPEVREVVLSENGILNNAKSGTLYIDMSSISPDTSKDIGGLLKAKGIRMLDAPVSGGQPKAIDGSLAIMVGGEEKDFNEALPIFNCLGNSALFIGPLGSGNVCKLANQVIVAGNIAALCEGLMLAKRSGVDPKKVYKAIAGGLAGSTVMNAKAPMMLERDFNPGFKINLHIKDLNNALDTGSKNESPMPITNVINAMMKELANDGLSELDHSGLIRYYEKIVGDVLKGGN